MSIREATSADLPELKEFIRAYCEEEPPEFFNAGALGQDFRRALDEVVVQDLPGLCLLSPRQGAVLLRGRGSRLFPLGIYVTPTARRRGVAASLLRTTEKLARQKGYKQVLFSPMADGPVSWFEKHGYRPVQVLMAKEL